MKKNRIAQDYLIDIFDTSQKAMKFVEGVVYADFEKNDEKIFAGIRALESSARRSRFAISERKRRIHVK